MNVDGIEVQFSGVETDVLEIIRQDTGDLVGRLRWLGSANAYHAETPDGRVLRQPSRWGGLVTAQFGTRELGVRALLENQ